jgi:hypothetical protein
MTLTKLEVAVSQLSQAIHLFLNRECVQNSWGNYDDSVRFNPADIDLFLKLLECIRANLHSTITETFWR